MTGRIFVDERVFEDSLNELTDQEIGRMTLGELLRRADAYGRRVSASAVEGGAS